MARTRMLSTVLLLALMVAAVLSVPGDRGQAGAVEPRETTASIMIPAAAFIPSTGEWSYGNNGNWLSVNSGGLGYGHFTAAVSFPVPVVTIKRITLYAYDNNPAQVCVGPYRARPAIASESALGTVCTTDSTADPQAPYRVISGGLISTATQSLYLHLSISGHGVLFYGAKITYSY